MSVWITRARPGADATAARLVALGRTPLVAPLLEVRDLDGPALDLDGVAALAFTSANGVFAFARRVPAPALAAFCVGEATAAAARAAGFTDVRAANGDVAALGAMIAAEAKALNGAVLHPCARMVAGDLPGELASAGIALRSTPIYETIAAGHLPPQVLAALQARAIEAVLVHSPRAGVALAGLLAPSDAGLLDAVQALAISPAALAPLAHLPFARRAAAARPDEAGLLALLS